MTATGATATQESRMTWVHDRQLPIFDVDLFSGRGH